MGVDKSLFVDSHVQTENELKIKKYITNCINLLRELQLSKNGSGEFFARDFVGKFVKSGELPLESPLTYKPDDINYKILEEELVRYNKRSFGEFKQFVKNGDRRSSIYHLTRELIRKVPSSSTPGQNPSIFIMKKALTPKIKFSAKNLVTDDNGLITTYAMDVFRVIKQILTEFDNMCYINGGEKPDYSTFSRTHSITHFLAGRPESIASVIKKEDGSVIIRAKNNTRISFAREFQRSLKSYLKTLFIDYDIKNLQMTFNEEILWIHEAGLFNQIRIEDSIAMCCLINVLLEGHENVLDGEVRANLSLLFAIGYLLPVLSKISTNIQDKENEIYWLVYQNFAKAVYALYNASDPPLELEDIEHVRDLFIETELYQRVHGQYRTLTSNVVITFINDIQEDIRIGY
ncbi:MAG: hypothetical protein ACXAEU_21575 [Candidatus Hodarchaeales archaeon]|jgi:hypothetical protein